jgi:glycosyltransferase involved in cell wall biosynthesis
MASVLSQSYEDFRLVVSDNASVDETEEVVSSFADPRVEYVRLERNIGMIANFNHLIERADTEFLVLLPDDDVLYPDYLGSVVPVLEGNPTVGVVHTACDLIDGESRVLERARTLLTVTGGFEIESRDRYLERSMHSTWTVCWPSALFRTRAILAAEGLRPEEEPLADVPLLMRIALSWDFAALSAALVGFRMHTASATADLGSFTGVGYDLDDLPEILYERRTRFLDEAGFSEEQTSRYRSLADTTFRRETIKRVAEGAAAGAPWMTTGGALFNLARTDSRILLVPATWRLVAAQLGGRAALRAVQRLTPAAQDERRGARDTGEDASGRESESDPARGL